MGRASFFDFARRERCIAGAHVVEIVRQFCCTRRFVGRNTDTSLAEILPGNLILRGAIFGNILFSQATFVDIIGIEIDG